MSADVLAAEQIINNAVTLGRAYVHVVEAAEVILTRNPPLVERVLRVEHNRIERRIEHVNEALIERFVGQGDSSVGLVSSSKV